jgi:signal transduction histidine kinase
MVAALTSVPEAVRGDAMIVVTELVSNAVRHGRRVRGGRIVVTSVIECVRMQVLDRLERSSAMPMPAARASAKLVAGTGILPSESFDLGIAAPAG